MWAELAAATADWSPLVWLGALGGAGGALGAAIQTYHANGRGRGRAEQAHAQLAHVKALMKDQARALEAQTGKLAASVNREVVGVTKAGKTFTATRTADGKLDVHKPPYLQDWCPGCNHIRGRKQMRWADDGASWVCRWCAKREVPPEGWCNCPDCQVFGQNAAHLPAHDVHLGPLAAAVVEQVAADSPVQRLQDLLAQVAEQAGDGTNYAANVPLIVSTTTQARAALRESGGGTVKRIEQPHGAVYYEVHQLGHDEPIGQYSSPWTEDTQS